MRIDKIRHTRYNFPGKATIHGRRSVLFFEGGQLFAPGKGAVLMVTYDALFLFVTMIVAIITLVINITKKK